MAPHARTSAGVPPSGAAAARGEGRCGFAPKVRRPLLWRVRQSFQNSPDAGPVPSQAWETERPLPNAGIGSQVTARRRSGNGLPGDGGRGGAGPAERTVQSVGPGPRRVSREGLGLCFCEHNCNGKGTLPSNQMEKLFAFYFKEKIVF